MKLQVWSYSSLYLTLPSILWDKQGWNFYSHITHKETDDLGSVMLMEH